MSEDCVITELPEDYVRRMRNWARADAGAGLYAVSSIYDPSAGRDRGEMPIPTLVGEAHDTHMALDVLAQRERLAVTLYWQHEGKGMRWLGRRLAISDKTAKARVLKGSEIHQAELRRRADTHNRQVEANARAMAEDTANHGRTGSVTTRTRVLLDRPGIPQ